MNNKTTPPDDSNSSPPTTMRGMDCRFTIAITLLLAIHIAIFVYRASSYLELIRYGVISLPAPLIGAVSDALLFFGVVLLYLKRFHAPIFITATIGLFLAGCLLWSQTLPFHVTSFVLLTYGFGSVVSAAAWWGVVRHKRLLRSIE